MRFQLKGLSAPVSLVLLLSVMCPSAVRAEERLVRSGDSLQAALDAARPGDILLLQTGAEFVGNFVLPVKTGDRRSSSGRPLRHRLPPSGARIGPAHAPLLARLRSPNTVA